MPSSLLTFLKKIYLKLKSLNLKKIKLAISILIVVTTFLLFYKYLSSHHQTLEQLKRLSPTFILEIIGLYSIVLLELIYILKTSLEIVELKLPFLENLLINSYSLMVNFFMFGQSGPGLRALYLKSKYKLKIKKFFYLTLLYYFYYFVISIAFILASVFNLWYVYILVLLSFFFILYLPSRSSNKFLDLKSKFKKSSKLFAFTLLQLVTQTYIFGLELNLVSKVGFKQLLSYSGFANLSLFASITPAGIGIRESFLILSRKISHVSSSTIVSASVIDRSIYIIFLILVLIFLLGFHSSNILKKIKNIKN